MEKNDDSGEKVLQNQTLKGKESAEEEGESVCGGGGGVSEWDGEGVRTGRGPEASYQMSTHSLEALAEATLSSVTNLKWWRLQPPVT